MGGGEKAQRTTTVVNVPAPSPEERALQAKQTELLELQIAESRKQAKLLEEVSPTTGALLKEQLALQQELVTTQRASLKRQEALFEEFKETPEQKEIRTLSEQRALAILKGEAPPLSPQQERFIDERFAEAERVARGELQTFAEDLAASRGMTVTDSPIGGEVLRRGADVAGQLAGARAEAKLNVGQAQQAFAESVRQFQEGLRQQAFMNRLALTGRDLQALPLAVSGAPALLAGVPSAYGTPLATSVNVLGRMQQERLAQPTTNVRGRVTYTPGVLDYVSALSELAGAAASAYGAGKSSARFKRDILPLDVDEYERARRRMKETPVTRWRYKWERDEDRAPHIGPILELSPEEIREDALHINLLDYAGFLHAGLKGVDRRVDRLEARLPIRARVALPMPSAV